MAGEMIRPVKSLVLIAVFLVFGIGQLTRLQGQTSTIGNITGTVRDQRGASIPKAEVVIKESEPDSHGGHHE